MTHEELKIRLEQLIDPTAGLKFKKTNGIETVTIEPNGVVVITIFLSNKSKDEKAVKLAVTKLIKQELGFPGLRLEIKQTPIFLESKFRYIAIASGKGGVGKSTVAVKLAKALTILGHKTAIIDSDVYGASIPLVFDVEKGVILGDEKGMMKPLEKDGIEVISTTFFMPEDKPLMWRAPLLKELLNHFYNSVVWDEKTEYIIIDLPPGTGDVAIDTKQYAPNHKVVIVTTPNKNASEIALKAGLGSYQLGQELIGVIENMSYYYNEATNNKEYLFGSGGGGYVANRLSVPLLGQIPIETTTNKDKINTEYLNIANYIIKEWE